MGLLATHDSIGLGEDGPTHQPVETAIHLRAIPNLAFWRPADGNETSAAYKVALESKHTPSILSLSRQNLPNLENSTIEVAAMRGGYVLHEEKNEDLTIVSTGSEVSIALEAAGKLKSQGIKTRVVSLPCWFVFDQQPEEYRLSVLRSGAPILSLEALSVWSHPPNTLFSWIIDVFVVRPLDGRNIVMRYVIFMSTRVVVHDINDWLSNTAIRCSCLGLFRTLSKSV
jgi:transketolase